ncbi:MAG: DUF2269 domain-containing protein [Acidobacteriota bacterium]|nr:DUF2269 domain-containing protein [Acidobacteriota bacterium]
MTPSRRKFALTTHITLSVGWIGAVLAYLVLVVAAMATRDAQTLRAGWIAMELIGWYLIVPLAITSLFTGLLMALGTQWGLFRHYWVLISLVLTIVATVVLLQHMRTVTFFAREAAQAIPADLGRLRSALRGEILHAGVGLVVLFVIEALNVYKPQGVTWYGRRRGVSRVAPPSRVSDHPALRLGQGSGGRTPRWVQVVGIHAIGLALLFLLMHLTGGGLRQH